MYVDYIFIVYIDKCNEKDLQTKKFYQFVHCFLQYYQHQYISHCNKYLEVKLCLLCIRTRICENAIINLFCNDYLLLYIGSFLCHILSYATVKTTSVILIYVKTGVDKSISIQ